MSGSTMNETEPTAYSTLSAKGFPKERGRFLAGTLNCCGISALFATFATFNLYFCKRYEKRLP